jgi:hypothetical protein
VDDKGDDPGRDTSSRTGRHRQIGAGLLTPPSADLIGAGLLTPPSAGPKVSGSARVS